MTRIFYKTGKEITVKESFKTVSKHYVQGYQYHTFNRLASTEEEDKKTIVIWDAVERIDEV